jgi:hypothetical protein
MEFCDEERPIEADSVDVYILLALEEFAVRIQYNGMMESGVLQARYLILASCSAATQCPACEIRMFDLCRVLFHANEEISLVSASVYSIAMAVEVLLLCKSGQAS